MDTKSFAAKADIVQLQNDLRSFYERTGYIVETSFDQVGLSVSMQVQKNIWGMPAFLGSASALNVKIMPLEAGTTVTVSGQKYSSHVIVAITEFILGCAGALSGGLLCMLWLGMVVPLFAAFEQNTVTKRTWEMVEAHITQIAYGRPVDSATT
jgi:hypothetical protein